MNFRVQSYLYRLSKCHGISLGSVTTYPLVEVTVALFPFAVAVVHHRTILLLNCDLDELIML